MSSSSDPWSQSSRNTWAAVSGSIRLSVPDSPSTSSSVNRSAEAVSTPSIAATASRTAIGMSEKPSSLEIVRSPISVLSIASLIEPLIPAANTATNETRARPTISAAAVEAVRPGLRTEFSRASVPGTPPKRCIGAPTTDATGVTSSGLSRATPRKTATAPTPTHASPGLRAPKMPNAIASGSEPREHDPGGGAPAALAGGRGHDAVSKPGDRRHPGRADRGGKAGDDRDHGAEQ